jgi:hypothetical protein
VKPGLRISPLLAMLALLLSLQGYARARPVATRGGPAA